MNGSCCVSQRYWKMKAIHNLDENFIESASVVVYPKDTEKWKQFTTHRNMAYTSLLLLCIPKILKNESNSQQKARDYNTDMCCCVSQRYWKMKAIHNRLLLYTKIEIVVVYPKDTEKWKQFTTSQWQLTAE